MTQEEKRLLLIDLCARLQSSLICSVMHKDSEGWKENDMVLRSIEDDEGYFINENGSAYSCEFKPYLRPMSSMTEEERKEYNDIVKNAIDFYDCQKSEDVCFFIIPIDWLNSHHFDYRGLIEKGLAIEAPEDMYKIE